MANRKKIWLKKSGILKRNPRKLVWQEYDKKMEPWKLTILSYKWNYEMGLKVTSNLVWKIVI